MEISKMLTISTSHIKESTAAWLDTEPSIVVYPKEGYGWFIYVSIDELEEYTTDVPADLVTVLGFTAKQGCIWLCLDCDANTIDELQVYNW